MRGVAHPAGVEPATSASGGQRSIQLSYGCIIVKRRNTNGYLGACLEHLINYLFGAVVSTDNRLFLPLSLMNLMYIYRVSA